MFPKLWQFITQLFAGEQAENKQIQTEKKQLADHEQRIQRLEQFKMKLGDDVSKLETLVPQVIAQSQADMKAAGTAQMLADEAKAELAAAENPDTVHRLEVQINALTAYVASRQAPVSTATSDTTAAPGMPHAPAANAA